MPVGSVNKFIYRSLGVPFITVDQVPYEMGTRAVDVLIGLIEGETAGVTHSVMETKLIVQYGLQQEIQHFHKKIDVI